MTVDLDELRSVQSKERRKDSLQHLRDTFYDDVAEYLAERKRQRDERAAAVDNPFSDDRVSKLSNEIETAEEVVESLYERRVGKVVKLSSFAAAGAPTDTDGMTVQEAELFEDLVVRIEQNKDRVLDVLDNADDVDLRAPSSEPATTPDDGATTDGASTADAAGGVLANAMGSTADEGDADSPADDGAATDPSADAAAPESGDSVEAAESDVAGGPDSGDPPKEFVPGSEPDRTAGVDADGNSDGDFDEDSDGKLPQRPTSEPAGASADANDDGSNDGGSDNVDRRTVRITRDVGEILGVDEREYELATEDVVNLPVANADPLVERDAAEPIE